MKITNIKLRDIDTCDTIAEIVTPTESDKIMRLWCLPSDLFDDVWLDVENVIGNSEFEIKDPRRECTWFVPLYFVKSFIYN